jgi:3-deoxy-7-phosphoheptulonate synthase
MIIIMAPGANEDQIMEVVRRLEQRGYGHHISRGVERTLIGAIGAHESEKEAVAQQLMGLAMVERVVPILRPYKLVSREHAMQRTAVSIGGAPFGGGRLGIIAGPCSIETLEQTLEAARAVKAAGAGVFRGGAFKPRTSPYDFQGLGEQGLEYLAAAREETGLPIITEVMDVRQIEIVAQVCDALQIGTRNMANFDLLKEVGHYSKPVILKRGFAATAQEWLRAAEYIAASGNLNIIMCERGIRTFETETRYTLDLATMAWVQLETHLPVVVDPSHATGNHRLVPQMSLAAVAAGADGLMIEVHPHPDQALSDGPQSLTPRRFERLMQDVRRVAEVVGRQL